MPLAQRSTLAESTFLPRPKRTLESAQYTLDAKLDIPFNAAGEHTLVAGTQVIRGELTDGVFGTEKGTPGLKQEHDMYSLFVEDNWKVLEPLTLTAGLRYDDHDVFGSRVSPRLYSVYAISDNLTVNARINNLLDRDFTTYATEFRDLDGDGVYEDGTDEVLYLDDYNNKDKARSVWVSLNLQF